MVRRLCSAIQKQVGKPDRNSCTLLHVHRNNRLKTCTLLSSYCTSSGSLGLTILAFYYTKEVAYPCRWSARLGGKASIINNTQVRSTNSKRDKQCTESMMESTTIYKSPILATCKVH